MVAKINLLFIVQYHKPNSRKIVCVCIMFIEILRT